jgi:tetrahydromethanopterin S-methyltransferase subunit D
MPAAVTVVPVGVGFCEPGWVSVLPGAVLGGLGGQVVFVELEQVVCCGD